MRRRTGFVGATAAAVVGACGCLAAFGSPGPAIALVPMPFSTPRDPSASGAIASSGPLRAIAITPDLACSVTHVDDVVGEFFGDTACGTFVAIGADVYGPKALPGAEPFLANRTWTPLAQSVSGKGTREAPYTISTSVGTKEFQLTEIDTYVVGDDAYRTDLSLAAPGISPAPAATQGPSSGTKDGLPVVIYHAGDCRLEASEFGLGSYTSATGAITCHPASDARTIRGGGHTEQFVPITPGSDYLYSDAADVWSAIAEGRPLPDEVRGGDQVIHNAIGLSWTAAVAPDATTTVSFQTSFAKTTVHALPTSLVLGTDTGTVGDRVAVTARIENPNVFPLVIDDLTAMLPAGASYVPGSATGIRPPEASGERLGFGSVSLTPRGLLVFHFAVQPTLAGSETLELAGVTRGGPAVLGSRALLRVHAAPAPARSPAAARPSAMSRTADATPLREGAVGAAIALFAAAAAIAAANSPRRRQRRLVRRHVRLDPHQASVIRIPPHPDPALPSPTFRLEGRAGAWTHHMTEEEP